MISVFDIAIIGGGFSGTLTFANLVRSLPSGTSVNLIDPKAGRGLAYGTAKSEHLLNVRADFMGAFADNVKHFYEWCSKKHPEKKIEPTTFVPRPIFGEYLEDILSEALTIAQERNILAVVTSAEATDISPVGGYHITLSGNTMIKASHVVLATGNPPPAPFPFAPDDARFIRNVWKTQWSAPQSGEVVIIGTGLTMIDLVMSLRKQGFKGLITAFSPRSLLPAPHAQAIPYQITPPHAPYTALSLLHFVKKAIKEHGDWRGVVDSLRPYTQKLWAGLSIPQRKRFLRHLAIFWNVRRHRAAPHLIADIEAQKQNGTLRILCSRVSAITPTADGLNIVYNKGELKASLVLQATGPDYGLHRNLDPLIISLLKQKLIMPHALGLGVGEVAPNIYPLAGLRFGDLFETIAVPELREQAAGLAMELTHIIVREKQAIVA